MWRSVMDRTLDRRPRPQSRCQAVDAFFQKEKKQRKKGEEKIIKKEIKKKEKKFRGFHGFRIMNRNCKIIMFDK